MNDSCSWGRSRGHYQHHLECKPSQTKLDYYSCSIFISSYGIHASLSRSQLSEHQASCVVITAVSLQLPLLPLQDLAFGKVFTDHMLLVSVLQTGVLRLKPLWLLARHMHASSCLSVRNLQHRAAGGPNPWDTCHPATAVTLLTHTVSRSVCIPCVQHMQPYHPMRVTLARLAWRHLC